MNSSIPYWLSFIIYSIVVILIGLFVWLREKQQNKQADNQAYWQADRNLSGWSVGLSISASMMSISWSGVYGVQLFYWYGPGGAWLLIIPWLVTMAGFFIMSPLFRKFKAFSQPDLLARRFGAQARRDLILPLVFVFITWTGAEIYAAGIIIAPLLNISLPTALLLITIVVAMYSFTGGFEAVVSTDKIQFILVAFFMVIMAGIGINALPDNISLSDFPMPPKMQNKWMILSPGITMIILTFFVYLPGWLIETDVWIRIQAGQSDKQARRGIVLAALNSFVFVGLLPLIIGLSALILYPPQGNEVHPLLADGQLILRYLCKIIRYNGWLCC